MQLVTVEQEASIGIHVETMVHGTNTAAQNAVLVANGQTCGNVCKQVKRSPQFQLVLELTLGFNRIQPYNLTINN